MIKAKINGKDLEVEEGTTILHAAKKSGIRIPTLCEHPDILPTAACGICIVRAMNMGGRIIRACSTPLENNMDIITTDAEIIKTRKGIVELILSNHPKDCLNCIRSTNCELQKIAYELGCEDRGLEMAKSPFPKDTSTNSIVLNPDKCIKCGRCVDICQKTQNVGALTMLNRGFDTYIGASAKNLADSPCVSCGQCSTHCPVAAIYEKDDNAKVLEALANKNIYTVVQMAPSVRVGLGELFNFPVGTNVIKKIYAAARFMGFKAVFDTNFGADLTIMEEGSEFVERFKKKEMPQFTSCCPGWVNYIEKFYPDLIEYLSSAKSPHQMLSATAKTYYAEKMKIDPAKMFVVSIMPCTAKKDEILRDTNMNSSGYQDTDVVITTREFARLVNMFGIDMHIIPDEEADLILGDYTGAGTIFGVTGGVMEAALRTASKLITGKELDKVDFDEATRGLEGIKKASLDVAGAKINIAVAHGLKNASVIMDEIRAAKKEGREIPYHFVEVMACPGGCVTGGGQPYSVSDEIRIERAEGLYDEDKTLKRCSHNNPHIIKLYEEYYKEPLSEKSHHLLHTTYKPQKKYKN